MYKPTLIDKLAGIAGYKIRRGEQSRNALAASDMEHEKRIENARRRRAMAMTKKKPQRMVAQNNALATDSDI